MTMYKWLAGLVLCLFLGGAAFGQADGTLDTTFHVGTGFTSGVSSIAIQPDGKVIVGGYLYSYNGVQCDYIARLNAHGSLDTTFNHRYGFDDQVTSLALQPDGKVIVGGEFTTFNHTTRNRIARLNADGTLDMSFDTGRGFESSVNKLALQQDGKVVAGGFFSFYNDVAARRIARINANGTLDTTFHSTNLVEFYIIYGMVLQPDGKIVVCGELDTYPNPLRPKIARLNVDGTLDLTFTPFTEFINTPISLALQSDGKIIVGGDAIARLNTDGSLDTTFNPGIGFNNTIYGVRSFVLQPDGKILACGDFTSFNSTARNGIARLNADGTLDTAFNPGSGFAGSSYVGVSSMVLQPDGKIIAGGSFTSYNGTPRNGIARLNNSFSPVKIKENDAAPILTLSPNPAHQTVTITSTQPVKAIRLSNTAGQQVRTQAGASETLDVSSAAPRPLFGGGGNGGGAAGAQAVGGGVDCVVLNEGADPIAGSYGL